MVITSAASSSERVPSTRRPSAWGAAVMTILAWMGAYVTVGVVVLGSVAVLAALALQFAAGVAFGR
jgi:hypothetical protein